jgi:phosphodiesterase/alkaline phosphatase D-like protein
LADQHRAGQQRWQVLANATLFGLHLYGATGNPSASNDEWGGYPRTPAPDCLH